jgi:HAE1 family hydrophobic/amphiphilic exporter-1
MFAASTIAIFVVPVLFVVITRLAYGKKKLDYLVAHHEMLMEKEKKVEQQDIDPALEFDIQHARQRNKPEPQ